MCIYDLQLFRPFNCSFWQQKISFFDFPLKFSQALRTRAFSIGFVRPVASSCWKSASLHSQLQCSQKRAERPESASSLNRKRKLHCRRFGQTDSSDANLLSQIRRGNWWKSSERTRAKFIMRKGKLEFP